MNRKSRKQNISEKPEHFALIIGAMKGGTTSLFEILSQHPEICPSKIKETDYFVGDNAARLNDDYCSLWSWNSTKHKVALESSVAYTKSPFINGVPERIFNSGAGEFKFIYILRNPIKRIESQVRHGVFAGWGKSLDEGMSADLLDFSRYAMQIDKYLEYFPKEKILLITLEDLKDNPKTVLATVCEFLGVDKRFEFVDVTKPRNSGEFFNAPPVIARLTQGRVGEYISGKLLPRNVKNWLRKLLSKSATENNNSGRWHLLPVEKANIINQLSVDLKRLEQEFGVNIKGKWGIFYSNEKISSDNAK